MKKVYTGILVMVLLMWGMTHINRRTEDQAVEFLNTLNEVQRERVVFEFSDTKREIFNFLPGSVIPRFGLSLKELSENQRSLLFNLLKHSISETGYQKVQKIISLEQVLAELEGNPVFRDPDNYFVSFYGTPSKDKLWSWSFEGHHLSLNFTITPTSTSVVPRFMGASPATVPRGSRKGEQTLANEEDLGLQLIQSMTTEQRKKAIFQDKPPFDIVTQNASEVAPLHEVGISLKELDNRQKEVLVNLISEYLSTLPTTLAKERFLKIKAEDFENIRFGWAGATVKGQGHYYRIQGKSFLVEFDNTFNEANHIHTVWREFDGDFGRDLIREHYQTSNHINKK